LFNLLAGHVSNLFRFRFFFHNFDCLHNQFIRTSKSTGCQCKACFRLSRGERLNADGVVARAYKNPKHHSKGAVLHYCGRTADQHGGYVNPCGLCDSVCGPTDGIVCLFWFG
jgi:hypothetical protein